MSNVWIELGLSRVDPSKGVAAPTDPGPDGMASVATAPGAEPSLAPKLIAVLSEMVATLGGGSFNDQLDRSTLGRA